MPYEGVCLMRSMPYEGFDCTGGAQCLSYIGTPDLKISHKNSSQLVLF